MGAEADWQIRGDRGTVKELEKRFRMIRTNTLIQLNVLRKIDSEYVCNLCQKFIGDRDKALAHVANVHRDEWNEATKYAIWKMLQRYGALPMILFKELNIDPTMYGFRVITIGKRRKIVVR
jgi:hypothetical protein